MAPEYFQPRQPSSGAWHVVHRSCRAASRAAWLWVLLGALLLHGLGARCGAPAAGRFLPVDSPFLRPRLSPALPARPAPTKATAGPSTSPSLPAPAAAAALTPHSRGPTALGRAALLGVALPGLGQGVDLDGPLSVAGALAVVAAVILVHELGHFVVARLLKIRVAEFNVGLGPKVWEYRGPDVSYAVRALPTGGYVVFPDDDPQASVPRDDPDLLRNRPVAHRLAVVAAGVAVNFASAFVLLLLQVQVMGIPRYAYLDGVAINDVLPSSPAFQAGLQANDVIVTVNGEAVGRSSAERMQWLVGAIRDSPGAALDLAVERDGQRFPVSVVPAAKGGSGKGLIGANLKVHYTLRLERARDLGAAVDAAARQLGQLTRRVVGGFAALLTPGTSAELSGPVKVISMGAEVARGGGAAGLTDFAAALNVNLAVLNMLPLPGLDGGAFLLLVVELLRGRRLPNNAERTIQGAGFLFFACCGAVVVFKDFADLLFPSL